MDKIDVLLNYIRKTNPDMTRDKLINELMICEFSTKCLFAIIKQKEQ